MRHIKIPNISFRPITVDTRQSIQGEKKGFLSAKTEFRELIFLPVHEIFTSLHVNFAK